MQFNYYLHVTAFIFSGVSGTVLKVDLLALHDFPVTERFWRWLIGHTDTVISLHSIDAVLEYCVILSHLSFWIATPAPK